MDETSIKQIFTDLNNEHNKLYGTDRQPKFDHSNDDLVERTILAQNFLDELGYPTMIFTSTNDYDKLCSKYYDIKKYKETADKISELYMQNKEIPQEYIDYMLKIKKIREENNL